MSSGRALAQLIRTFWSTGTSSPPLKQVPTTETLSMPAASAWVEGVLTSNNVSIITDVRSSARNYKIHQRSDRGSYQCWADQVGDSSCTFDSLLPYFKKSVNFTPPNTRLRAANASAKFVASAFDASGGPLDVSYANYAGPFSSYMEGGMNGIGIPTETTLTLETS